MIISYRHKFTFLHATKTGGSTVSVYFARHLGPFDIMIGSWGDAARHGIRRNLRARGHAMVLRAAKSLRKRGILRDYIDRRMQERATEAMLWDHASARQVRDYDPKAWAQNFKFTFVRNPFERVVSIYRWNYRDHPEPPSFSEMLRRMEDEDEPGRGLRYWNSWKTYTIDDRIAVDFVGRQENLADDLATICERVGVPFEPAHLTREKQHGKRVDCSVFYTPGDRERVERLFAPEIETFGYRFPGP